MNRCFPIEGLRERVKLVCKEIGRSQTSVAKECGFERKSMFAENWSAGRVKRFCEVTGTDSNWLLVIKGPDLRRNYDIKSDNNRTNRDI